MAHSPKFEMAKRYYNTYDNNGERMWDENKLRKLVAKGWITAEEFEEIVGVAY
jgi:hypothetical protein